MIIECKKSETFLKEFQSDCLFGQEKITSLEISKVQNDFHNYISEE
jgi:hypothetical protein